MTFAGRITPAQRAEMARRGQQQFRAELVAKAEAEARRLQQAYTQMLRRLDEQLGLMNLADEGALYSARSIERMRAQVAEALSSLTSTIEAQARQMEAGGISIGARAGEQAMTTSLGGVAFNRPSVESIRALVGYVDSASFQAAMNSYGEYHADAVADILLDGASRGIDPIKTARAVTKYTQKMPYYDALRTVRTVQLWSARAASHEIYRQNADVVTGWMWSSALGPNTCMACRRMHGNIFPLNKTLNDHHMGKCAPVPVTKSWGALGISGGSEVLEGVPTGIQLFQQMKTDAEQIAAMGSRAAWLAWKDGRFKLEDFAVPYQNAIYGEMTGEASLTDLVGPELAAAYEKMARAA